MRITINGNVTLKMLQEINSMVEVQETSDREQSDTEYILTGEFGTYDFEIKADEYGVDTIKVTAVNTCNPTDSDKLRLYMLMTYTSQNELAKQLGITKQALNQFLSGKRPVPKRILENLK